MQTNLLFGIHCHQPVDNFDKVVYEIIEKSYKPFFEILKDYPQFRCSVHFSGWLFEFIKNNEKELFNLIKKLSPQIEFFTGGYYEPILASIPSHDRVAQINKLSNFIVENFNQKPRGLWLTERIWDDSIIDDLKKCEIDYVIVDDYHLIASGFNKYELNGYFLTENSNNQIALFPISKDLRYIIPFATVENSINKLKEFANYEGKNAAIIFDDGEKFGVWPKTYEKVYEKKWLKNFFEKCIEDETINVTTYSEFFDKNKAISLSYLPTVSYHEMGEWSTLPNISKDYLDLIHEHSDREYLIRGGIWKNFFIKYNESNWIHKRALELSKVENQNEQFKDFLYRTQCNDVLWHGVFGGIYLPNLRDNAYKYIIKCENLLDIKSGYTKSDINMDSYEEYKFYTPELITIIDPKMGGQIVEFDIRKKEFNLQNTLTRYHETYHNKIQRVEENSDEVLEKKESDEEIATIHNDNILATTEDIELFSDWYIKKSAIDHITDRGFTRAEFKSCTFQEYGDFANQPFEVVETTQNSIKLKRDGGIYRISKKDTTLTKTFTFENRKIHSNINIQTDEISVMRYLLEFNFHFQDYEILTVNGHNIGESLHFENSQLTILDQSLNKTITFHFDQCIEMYVYPVKSVSQSESGVDYTIQGIAFGFAKDFSTQLDLKYTIEVQ
ncbi:alpha-amylase/4-alpha-glucanotransferase domain-containing protein [Halarcobacter ebronensis]|uniref:4-alpha-glucanotransferase n=1 Tax=Halarcobacter ebronensis TaxID=1462615 RepID=A0A4V1M0E3_9BACT|nr:alpha-amylase/4-alpha-glucanotransferase domain-containing protein [Halarcobacter ebronensis]QKF83243.1 4-alpha-glucanotransferase [Halarcobacter ebronensis]RXK05122.1 4-alpha-glucanotransferase [Halarcobacter ebronensis]